MNKILKIILRVILSVLLGGATFYAVIWIIVLFLKLIKIYTAGWWGLTVMYDTIFILPLYYIFLGRLNFLKSHDGPGYSDGEKTGLFVFGTMLFLVLVVTVFLPLWSQLNK